MQLIGKLTRQTRQLPARELLFVALWVAALAAVEVAGRQTTHDVADLVLLSMLAMLAAATAAGHAIRPLYLIKAGTHWLQRRRQWLSALYLQYGVDLRGTPAVPRALPPAWQRVTLGLGALVLLLCALSPWLPGAFRAAIAPYAYLVYLSLLASVLGIVAFLLLVHGFLTWATIHDRLIEAHTSERRRSLVGECLVGGLVAAALLAAASLLPLWVPVALLLIELLWVTAACWLASAGLTIVWRPHDGHGEVCGFDGRWLLWCQSALLIGATVALVLLCAGDVVLATPTVALPITRAVGAVLGWAGVAGAGVAVFQCSRFAWLGIQFHPERLAQQAAARAIEQSPDELRRDEIRHRRRIIGGLEKLFKRVARRGRRPGMGVWIGLQHWFIYGLAYDDDREATLDREATVVDEIVGPPYHRIFPPAARFHFWEIATALQIDLIFVEHTVSFRRFVRVLRQMFETYDIHGGRQRAEERFFNGLPGVRVVIHEFDFAAAPGHGRQGYPEPDYDDLGRARILHVLRDRDEHEELDPLPHESTGSHGPLLLTS